jgi:2-oxo-4-hydroxy-4-carboxy-5-ureidoimidazoline decarboxylase
MTLNTLNSLFESALISEFTRCCGSMQWVQHMLARRPFISVEAMLKVADEIWWSLTEADWKEAFSHHPRIGDVEALRMKFASTAHWALLEQAGAKRASEVTLAALAEGNRQYEQKFGYIFIVCATGKSAEEMLAILNSRLPNAPNIEIRIAAAEQAKITRLRLEKLLAE